MLHFLLALLGMALAVWLGYRVGWRHGAMFTGTCTRTLLTLRRMHDPDAEALERRFTLFH